MSILKNGEVGTIICGVCETKIHIANKDSLCPKIVDFKDTTCHECIDIIDNIKLDGTLAIFNIEKNK